MTFKGLLPVYILLLLATILTVTQATLIVHLNNSTSESKVYFRAVFSPTSPYPFNVKGKLYVMNTTDIEELKTIDLNDVIVLSRANTTSDDVLLSQYTYQANGLGFIATYKEYPTFFGVSYPVPLVIILYNDTNAVSDLWERSNRSLTVTIISDDNKMISLGRSAASIFLIVANLVILLATLAYVCYQLHSFKAGASVTKVALIGILVSNLGLIAERIVMLLSIYSHYVTFLIAPPISIIGPMFIAFSAIFISLYWSTLAFPTTIKMKSKQVFLPVLAVCILALIAYSVTLATGVGSVTYGLQIAFVILILIVATYFIVVGSILIRTLNKGNKIVATKRKITKRLTYTLILAGISMYGVFVDGLFTSTFVLYPESTFYSTRAILSVFCACSIATLAALFKKPKAKQPSSGANPASSGDADKSSYSRFNETR